GEVSLWQSGWRRRRPTGRRAPPCDRSWPAAMTSPARSPPARFPWTSRRPWQRQPRDALLGADDQVGLLVEVQGPYDGIGGIGVRQTERLADVLAVDQRLAEPGVNRAWWARRVVLRV